MLSFSVCICLPHLSLCCVALDCTIDLCYVVDMCRMLCWEGAFGWTFLPRRLSTGHCFQACLYGTLLTLLKCGSAANAKHGLFSLLQEAPAFGRRANGRDSASQLCRYLPPNENSHLSARSPISAIVFRCLRQIVCSLLQGCWRERHTSGQQWALSMSWAVALPSGQATI